MNYLKRQNDIYVLETLDNRNFYMCKWCKCYTKRTQYKNNNEVIRNGCYYSHSCNYCPKCLR